MTITVESFLTFCAGFTCVCVAGGWMIKLIQAAKKPGAEFSEKLSSGEDRLDNLEERVKDLEESNKLIIDALYQMLDHFETSNNTGGMKECKKKLFNYLND